MSRNEKMKFIRLIEGSQLCISDALARYDVPRSTYYRWKRKLRNQGIQALTDNKPYRARTWNQLLVQALKAVWYRSYRGWSRRYQLSGAGYLFDISEYML